MNENLKDLRSCLENIVELIDSVYWYAEGFTLDDLESPVDREAYMARDSIVYTLGRIGETINQIYKHSPDFIKEHEDLQLMDAYGMRNIAFHSYAKIRIRYVWETIVNDLPVIRERFTSVLSSMDNDRDDSPAPR